MNEIMIGIGIGVFLLGFIIVYLIAWLSVQAKKRFGEYLDETKQWDKYRAWLQKKKAAAEEARDW